MSKVTFYYNQNAESRLPFAKAVAEILGVKPKYTGVPKCAYIIDFATVTSGGNIEVDDQTDNTKLANLVQKLAERGYMTERTVMSSDEEALQVEDAAPTEQQEDQRSAQPSVNETANEATGQAAGESPESACSDSEERSTAEGSRSNATETTTISVPRDVFTDLGLDNLKKLLWAKNELICKALDIENTDIEVTDEAVNFPWFGNLTAEEIRYISQFISGLCEFANTSKRITSKQKRIDNPKFAMRTWAIRLGFGGAEHKDLRKYLMKRLPGDAAWRFGKPDNTLPAEPRLPVNVQVLAQ